MISITEMSDWLISLKLLCINMRERIYTTWQVWSNFIRVDAASWWSHVQYTDTAIIWGRKIQYGELTLFASVYFTDYVSNMRRLNRSGRKSVHIGTTSLNGFTSCNGRTISYIKYLYGDTTGYSWFHDYPGSGFGGQWMWHPIIGSVLEIYRY